MDLLFESLITVSPKSYHKMLYKSLKALYDGEAETKCQKWEVIITAKILMNEICDYKGLPKAEIVIDHTVLKKEDVVEVSSSIIKFNDESNIISSDDNHQNKDLDNIKYHNLPKIKLDTKDLQCDDNILDESLQLDHMESYNDNDNLETDDDLNEEDKHVINFEILDEEDEENIMMIDPNKLDQDDRKIKKRKIKINDGLAKSVGTSINKPRKSMVEQLNEIPQLKELMVKDQDANKSELNKLRIKMRDMIKHAGFLLTLEDFEIRGDEITIDYNYKCGKCDDFLEDYSEVMDHCKKIHSAEKVPVSKANFSESSIRYDCVLKCQRCGNQSSYFETSEELKEHIVNVHPEAEKEQLEKEDEKKKEKLQTCRVCKLSFDSPEEQLNHFKVQHGFACETCGKIYTEKRWLYQHKRAVHDNILFECQQCGHKVLTYSALQEHIKMKHKETEKHECEICHKIYPLKKLLANHHKVTHLGIKKYKCDECEKSFAILPHLKAHKERIHSEDLHLQCKYCGKFYTKHINLRAHLGRCHWDEIPENERKNIPRDYSKIGHKCNDCGEKFTNKYDLQDHINLRHKGVKLFCHICAEEFGGEYTLAQHVKKIHEGVKSEPHDNRRKSRLQKAKPDTKNEQPEKKFLCELCDKRFIQKQGLEDHQERSHEKFSGKDYICSICNKVFPARSELVKHKKYGHKNHECPDCDSIFGAIENYRTHYMSVHLNFKPWICHLCDFSAKHFQPLKRHLINAHQQTGKIEKNKNYNKEMETFIKPPHINSK